MNREDKHKSIDEKNERWGAREAGLEKGDYGFEADSGLQGSGREGAQGYGGYENEDQKEHHERKYGIQAGGNFGVYDIGGLGAEGYHHLANGTYDDMVIPDIGDEGFGMRHWGRGEFSGKRLEDPGVFERVGKKITQVCGKIFSRMIPRH